MSRRLILTILAALPNLFAASLWAQAPGAVTPVSPTSGSQAATPTTFTWNAVADTTDYQFYFGGTNTGAPVYSAASVCSGAICSVSIATNRGWTTWQLRAKNQTGDGPWSSGIGFWVGSLPGAVTLVSPTASSQVSTPTTFTWNAVADTTDYQFYFGGANTGAPVYSAASVCSGATCSVSIATNRGWTTWQLRAKNQTGDGPWSSGIGFWVGSLPGAVTLVSPTASSQVSTPTTFTWNAVADTTDYQFYFGGANTGAPVYSAASVCSGATCSVSIATNRGWTTWQLRAKNQTGGGPWSSGIGFWVGSLPGAVTLVSPTSSSQVATPTTFTWNAVADTTDYQFYFGGTNTGAPVYSAASVCNGATCSVSIATNRGWTTWQLRAKNQTGDGPWSSGIGFWVGSLPGAVTLVSPTSSSQVATPTTFTWNSVADTTDYQFYFGGANTGAPVYSAASVCSGATCSVSIALNRGWTTWQLRAKNQTGDGPWSSGIGFWVGSLPGAVTLVSPTASSQVSTPTTFTWNAIADTTGYQFYFGGANGSVGAPVYSAAPICNGSTCSVSITTSPGWTTWQLRAKNQTGDGPWSSGIGFTVNASLAVTPVPVAPAGAIGTNRPIFRWSGVPGALQYEVEVRAAAGFVVSDLTYAPASVCTGLACGVVAVNPLDSGPYTFRVRADAGSGYGPWSSSLAFSVVTGAIGAGQAASYSSNELGAPFAWGENGSSQLGDGTSTDRLSPIAIPGLTQVRSISGGSDHGVALEFDGTVWAWGANARGQLGNGGTSPGGTPAQVAGLSNVKAIAVGKDHVLALLSDGTVRAWGANDRGQLGDTTTTDRPSPVALPLANVTAIAAGANHSLALLGDGTVVAWGANDTGQLGGGTNDDQLSPTTTPGLTNVVLIASGSSANHSFAVKANGAVWAWGKNHLGQLGDETAIDRWSPVLVAGLNNASWLAAGESHSLAVAADGSVWTWGGNASGQLGNGTTDPNPTPSALAGLTGAIQVAAGREHSLVLRSDGSVLAWGSNASGQLGDGRTVDASSPLPVSAPDFLWKAGTPTFSVAPGTYANDQAVVLTSTTAGATIRYTTNGADPTASDAGVPSGGSVVVSAPLTLKARAYASGASPSNVASATYAFKVATPTLNPPAGTYSGLQNVTLATVTAGAQIRYTTDGSEPTPSSTAYASPIAIASTTTLKAKAFRSSWQDSDTAEAAYSLSAAGAISAGTYHSVAASSDGLVRTWGINYTGQLGDGTTETRPVPTSVGGLTDVVAVAAGYAFTVALKSDGTLWTWGGNTSGQLGLGDFSARLTPQQVPGITNATAIAVGFAHVLALLGDGSVVAWGSNDSGQLGSGIGSGQSTPQPVPGLTGVTAIAAGVQHSLALDDTGDVWSWGSGLFGALGDGSETDRGTPAAVAGLGGVVRIASGSNALHSFAVKADGTVWGWGANHSHQIESSDSSTLLTPTAVAGISNPSRIVAGGGHSLAVASDGSLWAWGGNSQGQTGPVTSSVPAQITGIADVAEIAAGAYHSLVLLRDGTLVAFGFNVFGQLGDGTQASTPQPTIIAGPGFAWKTGLPVFTPPAGTYAAALDVAIASATPGAVIHYTTTGADPTEADPVLANGASVHLSAPQAATVRARAWAPGNLPSDVATAAYDFRVGMPYADPAGDVYTAPQMVTLATPTPGAEIHYTTDGSEPSMASPPYQAPITISETTNLKAKAFLSGWTESETMNELYELHIVRGSISAGPTHLLYASADGDVLAWGVNDHGQLGTGTTNAAGEPTANGLHEVTAVAAGGLHSLALKTDGTVWSWGGNASGQLGVTAGADQLEAAAVAGLPVIRAIAAGSAHSLSLDGNGNVWAWGANGYGQLGNGSTTDSFAPSQVPNLTNVTAIAAGQDHSLALTSDGQVWAWGRNDVGQLGDGTFNSSSNPLPVSGPFGVTAIAAGSNHSLAIDGSAALWGWGQGSSRQLGGGSADPRAQATILGRDQDCVLISEGPEESCTFVPFEGAQVAEGGLHHSLAVVSLPSGPGLVSWGSETLPQGAATVVSPVPIADVARLSAADANNLALTQTGEVYYWQQQANGVADPVLVIAPDGSVPASVPGFDLAPGTYRTEIDVILTSVSAGATIRYTIDGSEPGLGSPEVASGSSVHLDRSTTLRARAFVDGRLPSAERSANYTLKVLDPTLNPPASGLDVATNITVTVATPGADLSYWIDGQDLGAVQNGTVVVTPPAVLVVTASRDGWESSSVSATYYVGVRTPVITPPGGHFGEPVTVTVTSATPGVTLRYTTDGTSPQPYSPAIASGGTLVVDRALTLSVKAWREDLTESQVASATFTYTLPKPALIQRRTAGPDSPLYVYGSSGVTWATVRCTTDGSEPNTISPPCARGIPIDLSTTVKAKAFLMGWDPSDTVSQDFAVTAGAVPVPTLSLPSGRYPSRRYVSVSSTASGAVLRYTTNGVDPISSDLSVPVDGRVLIDHSMALKVRAFLGTSASLVARGEYFLTGAAAVGGSTVLLLKTDGTVWGWGDNTFGRVGNSAIGDRDILEPVQASIDSVVDLASGGSHSVALKADGTVWTWGSGFSGELGTINPPYGPTQVDIDDVVSVAAAQGTSVALKSDGSLWTWGQGRSVPGVEPGVQCIHVFVSEAIVCIDSSGAALRGNVGVPFTPWEAGRGLLGPGVDGDGGTAGVVLTDGPSRMLRPWAVSSASRTVALVRGASAWLVYDQFSESMDRMFVEAGPVVAVGDQTIVSATGEIWRWGSLWGDGTPPPVSSLFADLEPRVVPGFHLLDDAWLSEDSDGDGLTNAQELDIGTDPYNADTNGDGIPDGVSVAMGRDPISLDLDGDGVSNADEIAAGTDPLNPDTDGDGHMDGEDLFPLDPSRWKVDPPNPTDTTPPTIILKQPANAVLISTIP